MTGRRHSARPTRLPASAGRRLGAVGVGLLALLVLAAVAAPLLTPYEPGARAGEPFLAPGSSHLLGTDDVGADLLTTLLYGARISLLVGVTAAATATLIGSTVGLVAGYLGGWVDVVLMRFVDVTLAMPVLPLMLVLGLFLGPGLVTLIAVIAATVWAGAARELRAQVMSARQREHVQAAVAVGASRRYVLVRHLLPDVVGLVVPQFVLATKTAILLEATLSFLQLGDPSLRSWGTMLSFAHARSAFLTDAWLWWVVPPGLCIATAVLAFALVGYAVEERARPELRTGRLSHGRQRVPTSAALPDVPAATTAPVAADAPALLAVENLRIAYGPATALAVHDVSLVLRPGETLGVVGESGGGKTTLVSACLGMLPRSGRIVSGRVLVDGADLTGRPRSDLRRLRGDRVALVPQESIDALNPVFRVGTQLTEAIRAHHRIGRRDARARAADLLSQVGVDPRRVRDYPHQLSGGTRQRVVVAMALANDPALLVADEPFSGLDVIGQAALVDLFTDLRRTRDIAILVVSHDLGAVLGLADRLVVMRDGCIVDHGTAAELTTGPVHPYTAALLDAVPALQTPRSRPLSDGTVAP